MPYFDKIADNLRNKYLELRAIEKSSDEMLKHVIDTFYLMEGLNRLQADLDCLDVLIKNNTYLERVLEFKAKTYAKRNSRKEKIKTLVSRSIKTIKSFSLYKQLMKKEPLGRAQNAQEQLKRMTYTQHVKISKLMEMVQGTIVTNCDVLQQLHSISGIPNDDLDTWKKEHFIAKTVLPKQNEPQEPTGTYVVEEQNQSNDVENIKISFDGVEVCPSKSCDSIATLCKDAQRTYPANTYPSAKMLYCRPKRKFNDPRQESVGVPNKSFLGFELPIGDGQATQYFEAKKGKCISSKCNGHQFYSNKSTETLPSNNHVNGDFVKAKLEDGMEIPKENSNKQLIE